MKKKWNDKIKTVLAAEPMRTGDLIVGLGFDVGQTCIDRMTRVADGLKRLRGSFVGSAAQRELGRMVEGGEVIWRLASNQDNWYGLPGQEFPPDAAPRTRTLRSLVDEVLALLPRAKRESLLKDGGIEGPNIIEFGLFNLSAVEEGWELTDGDPINGWAFMSFHKTYPIDVDAAVIARKILREWKRVDGKFDEPARPNHVCW